MGSGSDLHPSALCTMGVPSRWHRPVQRVKRVWITGV